MFALLTGIVYGPGLTMDPGYIKYGPGFLDCKPVHRPVIVNHRRIEMPRERLSYS